MFRPLRSLIGVVFLLGAVWCSFKVPLGDKTFADHMDRIGNTPEAEELLEGTRQAVNPVLEDATDRLLGEYIEAPTDEGPVPPPGVRLRNDELPQRSRLDRAPPPRPPRGLSPSGDGEPAVPGSSPTPASRVP